MKFDRIYELTKFIPERSEYFSGIELLTSVESNHENSVCKFLLAYKDLAFGHRFVRSFITTDSRLPITVSESSLRRLYNFEKYGKADRDIIKVLAIKDRSNQFTQNIIEALLIVPEITYDVIAEKTGIEKSVVQLYQELFFNVMDRKHEHAFIAEIVYPEHRMIELYDSYLRNESLGSILKRSGYNNGLEDVLYLSGFRAPTGNFSVAENAVKLESSIMANGYFLARNGFINQRYATGVNNARNLIAASKQGGNDSSEEDIEGLANSSMGSLFLADAVENKTKALPGMLELRAKKTGIDYRN